MTTPPPTPPTPPGSGNQPPFQPGPGYPQQPQQPQQPPQQPAPPPGYPQQGFPPSGPQGPGPQGPGPQAGYPQGGYQQPGPQRPYGPPTQFVPPPAPNFATPPPPTQHRLSGKIIAAIVAGVVIVAGGVGAAFALSSGTSNPSKPTPVVSSSQPAPGPGPTSTPAPGPTSEPAPGPTTEPAPGPSTQPAPEPTTSAPAPNPGGGGGTITVAGPVALRPAAGWHVVKRGSGYVILSGNGAELFVNVYKAQSTDITQNLIQSIEAFTKGTTGLRLGKSAPASQVHGRNFTQLRDVAFQLNISTQQGTTTLHGLFVQFLNPSSGLAAFCVYASPSESALNSNAQAGVGMIASME